MGRLTPDSTDSARMDNPATPSVLRISRAASTTRSRRSAFPRSRILVPGDTSSGPLGSSVTKYATFVLEI